MAPTNDIVTLETPGDTPEFATLLLRCTCGHETEIPSDQLGVA